MNRRRSSPARVAVKVLTPGVSAEHGNASGANGVSAGESPAAKIAAKKTAAAGRRRNIPIFIGRAKSCPIPIPAGIPNSVHARVKGAAFPLPFRACGIGGGVTTSIRMVQARWKFQKCLGRTAQQVLSALLVLQMLFLLVLAACPALHHALHPDSNSPDHHCLVTVFAKGLVSGSAATPTVVFVAAVLVNAVLLRDAQPRPRLDYRSAPSRAPPSF